MNSTDIQIAPRTCTGLREILQEYVNELSNYSETSYNQVVTLDSNPSITTKVWKDGTPHIDSYAYPTKFTKESAQKVCSLMNNKLGAYSKCVCKSYDNWLKSRIIQIENDLKYTIQ